MTQKELADAADVSYGMIRAVERGSRLPGEGVLSAIAAALEVDPSRLRGERGCSEARVHDELPAISRTIATYDLPDDGPVRPLRDLRAAVSEAVKWRLGAQYLRLANGLPLLLAELTRALNTAPAAERADVARLLVAAYRSADAVAYKFGALDLSARLIALMCWAAPEANDALVDAAVAYVRTETFFAAGTHEAGLRALEAALDAAPAADRCVAARAARGALHMRAAVVAARGGDPGSATQHLGEARYFSDVVSEGVYEGTAFGPSSVRAHEVSVAVSLGGRYLQCHRHRGRVGAAEAPAGRASERFLHRRGTGPVVGRIAGRRFRVVEDRTAYRPAAHSRASVGTGRRSDAAAAEARQS